MKLESLVIAESDMSAVNMFSSLVHTARHATGINLLWKWLCLTFEMSGHHGVISITGVKS